MEPDQDFRSSRRGRRQSWFGAKKHVKRLLALPLPHAFLRAAVRLSPGLNRNGRLPAPAGLREVEGRVDGRQFVMLRPDRCVIAKELYWGRGRRPRPEDDLAIHVFASAARRSDVILDVGAYTGLFTLAGTAVNQELRAHAFEIVPDVHRALQENCARNGIADRVVLHLEGVGRAGDRMRVPAASIDSALPDFYSSRMHFEDGVDVPFTSLDALVADLAPGARVAMKIDVEGTEDEVLGNGTAFLEAFRPEILCEVLDGIGDAPAVEGTLAPLGYRFYLVRERDLAPSEGIRPSPRYRDWYFSTLEPEALAATGVPVAIG
jgi:FkbM family methyltransferase